MKQQHNDCEEKTEQGKVIQSLFKFITFKVIPVKSIEEYNKQKKSAKVINLSRTPVGKNADDDSKKD